MDVTATDSTFPAGSWKGGTAMSWPGSSVIPVRCTAEWEMTCKSEVR